MNDESARRSGQPHQNLSQNIHQASDISGLKSRISITAGKRSAACGRGRACPAPLPERQDSACNPNPAFQAVKTLRTTILPQAALRLPAVMKI
jgi:hypothetical protein